MSTLSTLVVRLVGDAGGFNSMMQGAAQTVQRAGQQMSSAGASMTRNVTLPIAGIGTAAVLMGNQFNSGMANVISLVPDAADEIAGLRGDVQDLAVEMGQSTGDMTAGLYQVVSAFGYSADSMDLLRISAMAGAAGLATTTDAINLVSAVTRSYGDTSVEAAQKASDLAFVTVQMGQTNFPELAASIGRVTPLAASLGVAQEELFAVMASGSGVTGQTAEVSTQLRGVLQSLMAPTDAMTGLLESMGYASGSAMLADLGLMGSIQAITGAAAAAGVPLQDYIGSIEGQTLAIALAGPLADDYSSKLAAMGNAAGATQMAFDAQTQGVNAAGFAMQQAAIQMQVVGQELGNALAPAVLAILPLFQQFVSWIQGLVAHFTALDPQTQAIILGVIGFAAALGPLLMVLGPIVTGLGTLLTVVGALVSPIGLVIAAVVALGAAVVAHFGGVQETITAVSTFVQGVLAGLASFVQGNGVEMGGFVTEAWQTIQSIISGVAAAVQSIVETVFSAIAGFIDSHGAEISAFMQSTWSMIQTIIQTALAIIQATVVPALAAIAGFISSHGAEIQAVVEFVWNAISTIITVVLASIQGTLQAVLAIIRGDWDGAHQALQASGEAIWTAIANFIGPLINSLANTIAEALTSIRNHFQAKLDAARAIAIGAFNNMVAGVVGKATELRDRVVAIIINMRDQIFGIADGLTGGMFSRGAAFVTRFADGVMSALRSAIDAARALAQQLADLLPGSDARTGPLSRLGAMGAAFPMRFAEGIYGATDQAVSAAERMAAQMAGGVTTSEAGLGRLTPATARIGAAVGGPVTVNISGPWYVREEADIERIAAAVAEVLGRRAATNRRMNVGWAVE